MTTTTQLTSKKIKLVILIGAVIFFPAFFVGVVNSMGSYEGERLLPPTPIWVTAIVGFVTLATGKFLQWWHHG